MIVEVDQEPEQRQMVLLVGQDQAGHWLVQDSGGMLEGRFVSRAGALAFARSERHAFPGAVVALTLRPLIPAISFDPVRPDEHALPHAA